MSSAPKQKPVRYGAGALCCLGAALALGACSEDPRAAGPRGSGWNQPRADGGPDEIPLDDAGAPPPPDAGGLCGNVFHDLIANAPNIYFVLDASGSMAEAVTARATRYDRVRDAAVDLVSNLGPLINVGAAVFPLDATDRDACRPGDEVFSLSPGDPFTGDQASGTTTQLFRSKTNVVPLGGTPTAATLRELTPKLTALSGKTIVLLATDGGPNCNPYAACSARECIQNIEVGPCDPIANCCSPSGPSGPEGCIDRDDSVAAIAELAANGIDIYVIGVPGSEVYGDVLDDMALAGGAPQFVSPFYYKVDNLDTLSGVLSKIASVVVSCEFDLIDPPEEQGLTNVYIDGQLLSYDAADGWSWKSASVVELRGATCERLKNGKVKQVQIVSGCPTEIAQ